MRNYKIEDEDYELKKATDSKSFVKLDYKRSHNNYIYDQKKNEIYRKTNNKGLRLVCVYESGVLGGSWTGSFYQKVSDFSDMKLFAGNHAERKGLRTGTKGHVDGLYLDEEDDKIIVTNTYKTGKWSRVRDWTIEIVED